MPESTRLFFGNPTKTQGMKPMPPGERKVFGEAQLEPVKGPQMLSSEVTVLAYGNQPMHPMPDLPFQVVDGKPTWTERPKE